MQLFPNSHPCPSRVDMLLSLQLIPADNGRRYSYPIIFGHPEGEYVSVDRLLEYAERLKTVVESSNDIDNDSVWDSEGDAEEGDALIASPGTHNYDIDPDFDINDCAAGDAEEEIGERVGLGANHDSHDNDVDQPYNPESRAFFDDHGIDLEGTIHSVPLAIREQRMSTMEVHLRRRDELTESVERDRRDAWELVDFAMAQMKRCRQLHLELSGAPVTTPGQDVQLQIQRTRNLAEIPGISFERVCQYITPVYLLPLSRGTHAHRELATVIAEAVSSSILGTDTIIEQWDRASRAAIDANPDQPSNELLKDYRSLLLQKESLKLLWSGHLRRRQVLDYEELHDLPEAWMQRNETFWDGVLADVSPDLTRREAVQLPGLLPLQVRHIRAGFWPVRAGFQTEGRQVKSLIDMLRVRMRMKIRAEVRFQVKSVIIWGSDSDSDNSSGDGSEGGNG